LPLWAAETMEAATGDGDATAVDGQRWRWPGLRFEGTPANPTRIPQSPYAPGAED
jgi:hypothetical protein